MEFLSPRNDNPSYVIRVLLPFGAYPNKSVITNNSILYINEELCFSVVPYERESIDNEFYYSEVEWATLNEIKLYSSIVLSVEPDTEYLNIYPFRYPHYLKFSSISEVNENIDKIKNLLIQKINSPVNALGFNTYRSHKENFLPPVCGGEKYDLRDKAFIESIQSDIYSKFDTSNHLLVRGVSTLLRSRMLSQHIHFIEEAINTTFISLEASFRLVLKELKSQGIINPSSHDAAKHMAKVFSSETANKYFEEYYESRIMSFHPESRFGVFPHAPLMVDDHYDLFNDLSEIYTYFITGYVNPKYKSRQNEFKT